MEDNQELKKAYQNSRILYVAFMGSLVIYLATFEILKETLSGFQGVMENDSLSWLPYIIYALGLAQVFLIKFIREKTPKNTVDIPAYIQYRRKLSVISASLCEVPVLLGWTLFLLSGVSRDFYLLLTLSFVLFMVYFPRYTDWEMSAGPR